MPNIKSAIKRVKTSEKRRLRNRPVRNTARSLVKNARKAIASGDLEAPRTQESLRQALSYLDRAVSRGVIHKNNAARRKSRLMKMYNKAQAAKAASGQES